MVGLQIFSLLIDVRIIGGIYLILKQYLQTKVILSDSRALDSFARLPPYKHSKRVTIAFKSVNFS